jgi:hypothetical protein
MTHHRGRRAWLSEAVIIAVLMLLPLLFWWRLWALDLADRAVIPEGDFTSQYYPLQLFSARELAEGRVPAWDPYLNAGQPGLADIQTGFFYPLNLASNLVLALFGLPFTVGLLQAQVVLHFSLASLFTYLLVRHLARRAGARLAAARLAGAVAALTFTYAGYLTSFPVQQLTILETAVWLPLVLLFEDRAGQHSRPLPQLVLAGAALACALLAGHPQTGMYVVYAAVAYGIFASWTSDAVSGSSGFLRRVWRAAIVALVPVAIGVGLAAVQLVPTLQFIALSTRSGLDYAAVSWGFPLAEMVQLLYPGYFGGSPQYVGILAPVLTAASLFVLRARREVLFWITLGLVALLLSLGRHTFFYTLAYLFAPGFGAVRDQERIIFLFSLAVSILAGYGALVLVQPLALPVRRGFRRFVRGLAWAGVAFLALTGLWYVGYLQGLQQGVDVNQFEGLLRHHLLLLLILGGAVALFVLRAKGMLRRTWLVALTLGLIVLNLFTVNWQFNLAAPSVGGPFPETGLVSFLKAQPGTFRISSAGLLPGGASAGIVYGIEDITGNTPLRLDRFEQFEEGVGSWRRWQLLNVAYVLSDRDLDGPGLERVYEEEEVKVYRVGDPLPRAWVVYDVQAATDGEALTLLNADEFHPLDAAVVVDDSALAGLPRGGGPGSPARVIESRPGRLVLDLTAGNDGLLVVSQPFYPGWRATVDGEAVQIFRVDYLLQGVEVPAGSHQVELAYRLSLAPAIVSLVVLLACLVGICAYRRRA